MDPNIQTSVPQNSTVNPQSIPTAPATLAAKPQTSKIAVISLLLVFPPAAYVLMWRDKSYHSWFGGILIFTGLISLVMILLQLVFVVPQIATLYRELNIKGYDVQSVHISLMIAAFVSVLEVVAGWYVRNKARKEGKLSQIWIIVPIFLVVFSLAAPSLLMAAVVTPVYTLMGQF